MEKARLKQKCCHCAIRSTSSGSAPPRSSNSTALHVPQLTHQFSVASPYIMFDLGVSENIEIPGFTPKIHRNPMVQIGSSSFPPLKMTILVPPFCREESAPGNWPRPQSRVAPEEVPGEQVPPKNHGKTHGKIMEKGQLSWSWILTGFSRKHDFVTKLFSDIAGSGFSQFKLLGIV